MKKYDVLIAGGGVIGLMAGWTLARKGARVAVVDSGLASATHAAAGMLSPSFERSIHKGGEALARFGERSLARWRAIAPLLEERSGLSLDFDESGVLSVAFDENDAAQFEADAEGGEALNRKAVLALEPALSPSVLGGRFAPRDGQIDPRRVRSALETALQNDGGELRRGKSVARVLSDRGRTTGVALADGERIGASAVILSTGARIPELGVQDSGLEKSATRNPSPQSRFVFPVKGEALSLERVAGSPSRVVRTKGAYLCPKADGRVVVGATEVEGDWSLSTDEARIAALKKGALFAFPALKSAGEIQRWAGLRPATRDGAPIIGPAPSGPGGLFYALGHYRNGVLFAPATADALAALILENETDPSIAAFGAARFS